MALTDYAGLLAALADFSVRADQGALWPACVALAEARASRELRVRPMVGRAAASFSTEYFEGPRDLVGAISLELAEAEMKLTYVAPQTLARLKRADPDAAGPPRAYSVVGREFQVWPAPSGPMAAELTYWRRIPALGEETPSNWLLAAHPDVYLYGALLQFAMTAEDERLGAWAQAYETALAQAQGAYPTEPDGARLRVELPL
ncbi:hypothetical protein [Caulobacter sp. 17J80-11]|uniref:phage adaptor protein n=1 Tax=Caulobacter sp. 17J80-11 TaxID=2763502 RepID=UPI00165369DF|nr:hypothetical protein [Caulobacter sp. 17J80-11]MBC6982112.1 hypothetical protein [Caulobacter sp. 17J80-11]